MKTYDGQVVRHFLSHFNKGHACFSLIILPLISQQVANLPKCLFYERTTFDTFWYILKHTVLITLNIVECPGDNLLPVIIL